MRTRLRRRKIDRDRDADTRTRQLETDATTEIPGILRHGGHDFRRLHGDRDDSRNQSTVPVRLQRTAEGDIKIVAREPDAGTDTDAKTPASTTADPTATPAPDTGADEFLKHDAFGPELVTPGSGAFDATYTPATGMLDIKMRGNINFTDGISDSGGTLVAATGDLTQAATDGNNLPPEQRANFLKQFQWDDASRTSFHTAFESSIESAWGGQFTFHCTRPGWDKVTAKVNVDVDVRAGAAAAKDHLGVTSYKVPENGQYQVGNFVGGTGASKGYNPMTVDSTSTKPNPDRLQLLRRRVFFENNSAELSADALNTLKQFSIDFQTNNIPASNPVVLEGHASAIGTSDYNLALSEKRTTAVRAELERLGFNGIDERTMEVDVGEEGADDAHAAWFRRVELIVGSGEGQVRAAHEFGHALGLADEYAINPGGSISGTGQATGTMTGHDGLAKQIGAPGSVNENNDNIMSLGNTVRPQHYATFGAALRQLTKVNEWSI